MNLTPEQIQSNADAVKAHLEGKEVEFRWMIDEKWSPLKLHPAWSFNKVLYRPKPEPKTRPWSKPDDVPAPICWIRFNDQYGFSSMVTAIRREGIVLADAPSDTNKDGTVTFFPWDQLDDMEYSADRINWKKCEVTES